MEALKNYIRYFKDVTFDESPFNDVDNVLLSSIAYLSFDGMINDSMTLKQLGDLYFDTIDYKKVKAGLIVVRRTIDNFKLMYNGDRYKDIIVSDYVKNVDKEKQFCAMKFRCDNFTYVAYEGTDDSIIGWKEDFQLIYKFPVPSQKLAYEYLNKVIKYYDKKIYVGGHSKGGNLAMTAYMYAKTRIKKRVVTVYNNDGPGFRKKEYESAEYKEMLKKLKMIIPEQSVIGLLLRHDKEYKVIKSSGLGVYQHNLNNWECYGPIFIEGQLSEDSQKLEKLILSWLENHDDETRKKMVEIIFDIVEKCGIKTTIEIRHIKFSQLIKMINLSHELDKESKELLISVFRVLILRNDKF